MFLKSDNDNFKNDNFFELAQTWHSVSVMAQIKVWNLLYLEIIVQSVQVQCIFLTACRSTVYVVYNL